VKEKEVMAKNLEQILAKSGLYPDEFLKWRLPNPTRNKYLGMQALKKGKYVHVFCVFPEDPN
jgi:hypothetical protein